MRGATKFWYLVSGTGLMPSSSVVLPQDTSGMRKVEIYAPDKNMNGNTLEITITNEIIDNNIIVVNPYYKIVAHGQHS